MSFLYGLTLLLLIVDGFYTIDPESVRQFDIGYISHMDTLISMAMQCQTIPAVSIVVVRIDTQNKIPIAYAKGFGTKNDKRSVDAKSIFCIGDITDTFTAVLVAWLREKDVLNSWDTPITQLLSSDPRNPIKLFKDDTLNNLLTLRDILSKRVAFPDYAGMKVAGFPAASRLEFIDGLEHFIGKNWTDENFRSVFARSGSLDTLAGYICEQLVSPDSHWEDLIQSTIFKPLSMSDATMSSLNHQDFETFANSVVYDDGGSTLQYPNLSVLEYQQNTAPSDSICVSARDMIGWLNFLASKGTKSITKKPVLKDSAYFEPIFEPSNPSLNYKREATTHFPAIEIDSFGLGWELGKFSTYSLVRRSSKYFGYQTAIWILPEMGLAAYVSLSGSLTNEVANAIAETSLTMLLPMDPPSVSLVCSLAKPIPSEPVTCQCGSITSEDVSKIIGVYTHNGLGSIKVYNHHNSARVLYGQHGLATLCKSTEPDVYWLKFLNGLQVFHESCPGVSSGKLLNTIRFQNYQNNQYLALSASFLDPNIAPIFTTQSRQTNLVNKEHNSSSVLYYYFSKMIIIFISLLLLLFV